jgi:ubiquinone/menaquinone biosynthesis C-methylase UbiE
VPKKLVARDHGEAYAMWAEHFDDPALMANRDAKTTLRKLARVVTRLPLTPTSSVLDVGPGDGALFRLIAQRVDRCSGVDPSEHAVRKLTALFADTPNVEFVVGSASEIPYGARAFDIVVINSVLQALPTKAQIEASLAELVRVCKPGGTIFVGELPFRNETSGGILPHLARKVREFGPVNLGRLLYRMYARPVLRGEPIVLYPASNIHVPAVDFVSMCKPLGVGIDTYRHRELRRDSLTRNDYVLTIGKS